MGKSLWVRLLHRKALWVDLLDPETFRAYSGRPERLRHLVAGSPGARHIVIDEVQKVPEILTVVHGLLEENQKLRFILTGSSARKLKSAGVDLLAGRAVLRTLHPFMAAELGQRFRLDDALAHGLVPLVVASRDPEDTLKAYHALYLKEEVQAEGLVRNLGSFSRFLEAMTFSHASVLNLSNVARECEVERKTVEGFLQVLEDLLLGFRLPVFTRRARREMSAHPKFYFFDAGVFRSLRPQGPLDRSEELDGACLEGLVVQHLRAWNAYRSEQNSLHFWRTRSGVEVDVVVYGKDGFWAIEVKNSRKVQPQDFRSLIAFREDYPECRAILVHRGMERFEERNVLCIPCDEFLRGIHPRRKTLVPA